MLPRPVLASLPQLLRTLRPVPVAAMSTGTFVVTQPLNYRGGARVEPVDASGTEKAFEPATGNGADAGLGAAEAREEGRRPRARRARGLHRARPGRPRSPGGSRAAVGGRFSKPGPGAELRRPGDAGGRP